MWLLSIALLLSQADARPTSPADAIAQAHADLQRFPVELRADLRYFSFYSLPADKRPAQIQVQSGHCNLLSRGIDLRPVEIVPGTLGSLVRVNLRHYRWNRATWEKLADPYFTAPIEVVTTETWAGGVWPKDGKYYPPGSFQYTHKKKKVQALALWLTQTDDAKRKLDDVVLWTQSRIPVVRGDWFLRETSIQEGRNVGYYDLLEIKNQKDFEKVVRFSAEFAAQLEFRRVKARSGIALQARRVERVATVLGGLWKTFDNVKAVEKNNPLAVLDDDFKFAATEQIGPLPNGMPGFFLGDAEGTRQDKAPDNIVGGDTTGSNNDTRIHIGLSCVRCHFGVAEKEMGVKEVKFTQPKKLRSVDYEKLLELERQYLRDIAKPIRQDRENYQAAIKTATGMEPFEFGREYGKAVAKYEGPVDAARAAADLGVTKERMLRAFRAADAQGTLDPELSLLLDGDQVDIVNWEDKIQAAHLVMREHL